MRSNDITYCLRTYFSFLYKAWAAFWRHPKTTKYNFVNWHLYRSDTVKPYQRRSARRIRIGRDLAVGRLSVTRTVLSVHTTNFNK